MVTLKVSLPSLMSSSSISNVIHSTWELTLGSKVTGFEAKVKSKPAVMVEHQCKYYKLIYEGIIHFSTYRIGLILTKQQKVAKL